MNPIFRWAGSKRQISQLLFESFPESFERYVEPFCGSASLFFLLEPKKAILSDINSELTTTYTTIKRHHKSIKEIVESMVDDRDYYNCIRAINPQNLSNTERSARFIYLNRLCFNGLYRTNRKGEFNVPYSGSRTRTLEVGSTLREAAHLLKNAQIEWCDFLETLRRTQKGDFVYIDPPYATEGRGFCEYSALPFNTSTLDSLLNELKRAHRRGVKFMLSYANCKEIEPFTSEWKSKTIAVRRNISGFSGHRRLTEEVMIRNY
jgi:DNA adenine methylase